MAELRGLTFLMPGPWSGIRANVPAAWHSPRLTPPAPRACNRHRAAGGPFGLASLPIELPISTVLGAAAGALVNHAFMDHVQTLARGHFTIWRFKRKYGADEVKKNDNLTYHFEILK